ncbi:hypothetical protein VFPPC_12538 [Pochonia chlamydosporia 170]|uniref:Uncharacterized protein n=1 Tax=Pochonia chlamydosporia 170 TaxID=1380566 RepID=A0A179EWT1_METCM|nr:hypothetical protein VFPPC_12538 [Pochonia chlamydosporia 170]OAQ57636.2 hypothetical protein VFPPC_12538 [Pochonia chlamydosporia 170]
MYPLNLICVSFTLLGSVYASIDATYDFKSGLRPENVTGLNYGFYYATGSYYNGTVTFTLRLQDPDVNDDGHGSDNDPRSNPCARFIGSTIHASMDAVAAISMPIHSDHSEGEDASNPIRVRIAARVKGTNSTGSEDDKYQTYEVYSNGARSPNWFLNTSQSSDVQYQFSGIAANDSFFGTNFALNLTQQCAGSSIPDSSEIEQCLYAGSILQPFTFNNSNLGKIDWTKSIPYPQMKVQFDNNSASIDITGLFEMEPKSALVEIVGSVDIGFSGTLDGLRSDSLLLGQGKPKWNATLGFTIDSVIKSEAGRS